MLRLEWHRRNLLDPASRAGPRLLLRQHHAYAARFQLEDLGPLHLALAALRVDAWETLETAGCTRAAVGPIVVNPQDSKLTLAEPVVLSLYTLEMKGAIPLALADAALHRNDGPRLVAVAQPANHYVNTVLEFRKQHSQCSRRMF